MKPNRLTHPVAPPTTRPHPRSTCHSQEIPPGTRFQMLVYKVSLVLISLTASDGTRRRGSIGLSSQDSAGRGSARPLYPLLLSSLLTGLRFSFRPFFFFDRVSCNRGWPLTHCVVQDELELRSSCLYPSSSGINAYIPRCQVYAVLGIELRVAGIQARALLTGPRPHWAVPC